MVGRSWKPSTPCGEVVVVGCGMIHLDAAVSSVKFLVIC